VTALVLATVVKMRQAQQQEEQQQQQIDYLEVSISLYESILSLGLDGIWNMRPLLDGRTILEVLDLPRGPEISAYLDEQVRWMLLNPAGTREECQAHLLSLKRNAMSISGDDDGDNIVVDDEDDDPDRSHHGMSDGKGNAASSPVSGGERGGAVARHFTKKMHVESMDLVE